MTHRYLGITALSTLLTLTAITGGRGDDTATLLPNAIQYFMDANGKPLANGKVFMYTPSTTNPKTTWTTADKATAQPQPFIPLGIAGKPANPIYGDGSYRQLVKDQFGNTIWDFNTASTGSGGSTPVVPTIGDGVAVGTLVPFNGFVAPANYAFAYGQELSRTTYSALLAAITSTQSIVCTAGTNIISNFSDTSQLGPTMPVEVSCLPPGTTISAVSNPTTVTVSANATISGVFSLQVFPSGRGNGSTTFNVPDMRGRAFAGRDNMGGTAANRITSANFNSIPANGVGQSGGSDHNAFLSIANLPPFTPAGTITNGAITSIFTGTAGQAALTGTGGSQAFTSGSFASQQVTGTVASSQATSTFAGTPVGGTSAAFSVMQPTQLTNYLIKIFPDSLGSDATWQVPLNSIPVGRGVGTGFDNVANNVSTTPKFLQQSGDGTTATIPIWGTLNQFFAVATMSGLRGLAAGVSNNVYLQGYYGAGDGGEGQFYWNASSSAADNGGTIIIPNTAPATGRWIRTYTGQDISVRWFGAKGDGITVDQTAIDATLSLAISVKGGVYFPATPTISGGCYRAQVTIPDGTSGLYLKGDAVGYPIFNGPGSAICVVNSAAPTLNIVASIGGNINNIYMENLKFWNNNTGQAVKIYGAGFVTMRNIIAYSEAGTTFDLKANAYSTFDNLGGYTNSGLALLISSDPILTNAGPNTFIGSLFSTSGTGQSTRVSGDPLGVTFINTNFQTAANITSTQVCSVDIDGPATGTPIGSVQFLGIHNESNYNFAGTLSDICVGRTFKFGSVAVDAGNSWGAGDGTHFPQYFIHAYAARNLSVKNFTVSKLGFTGYTGAMIRIDSGALDQYSFVGNIADTGSGLLYSDANGKCSGTANCVGGGLILDTLALGTALAATSGGTGKSSYVVGDLLYADSTTTLARLADAATANALISGGVGVAPSWGKIGNSTLTNSSTTVNGQTCTLGSSCTVTAAASGVVVGTTTVGSGTTTRILYDNAGVLGEYTISGSGTTVAMNTGPSISGPTFTSTVTATGLIKNSDLAIMTTNTVKGNATSGTAAPTDLSMTSCSTTASAVIWTTNTGFGCNTTIVASSATSATNATNGATVATATNASFFPLFAASSTNSNQPFNLDTNFTYNPSTDTLTAVNFAGNAATASAASVASTTTITDDTTTSATMFPTWVTAATGNLPQKTTSTKLTFNPSTGVLSSTSFTGAGTGLTGTAASLTAGSVTTNANLTGAVTSVGNAASLGSFSSANLSGALTDETGSGVAVFGTSPTLSTVDARGTWTTGTSWTLPAHTLGGTISGGGNQLNNVIIGTTTPLAGSFTTLANSGVQTNSNATAATALGTGASTNAGGSSTSGAGFFGTKLSVGANANAVSAGSTADFNDTSPNVRFLGNSNNDQVIFSFNHSYTGNDQTWQMGMAGSSPPSGFANKDFFIRDGSGTAYFGITSAGVPTARVLTISNIASDTATVDNTMCITSAGVTLKGTGTLGICLGTSSAKFKHDIVSMGAGLAEIVRLSPKNFFYNKGFGDDGKRQQYGFIAEEVVKVLPGVTAPDNKGAPQSVDMLAMVPVLVNAIKQLKVDNDNLRLDVLALQAKAERRKK